ncbi:MAG TPA: biotin--[acetyl-CoA-carboxylase] ligase [Jiangellaceae bacterium]|nr:biotin--[acetyl-CoA-carboxylase] ligase [Jiangellaceae bacterium]
MSRVASTASTNADVADAARAGEPEGYVLVADEQTAGRGRLGRRWSSPPGTSLSVSVLLRPADVPATAWSWLPLLLGVAAVEAVRDSAAVEAVLKWPNDVQRDGRKLAGILVERVETPTGPAAVAGIGMNIAAAPEDAVSLADTGAGRDVVLDALLTRLAAWYQRWLAAPGGAELAEAYQHACGTLGRHVRVVLPGGGTITGRATGIDADGRLVLSTPNGECTIGAGDIIHLRTQ